MLSKVSRMCTKKDQAAKAYRLNSGNNCYFFNNQITIDAVANNTYALKRINGSQYRHSTTYVTTQHAQLKKLLYLGV